jgi:hypothetical protein
MNFVTYKTVEVTLEDDYITKGCISQNMYQNTDISFTSLRSLLDLHNHKRNITFGSEDIIENIKNTIHFIYTTTGIDTYLYFSQLAYLDSIILNEDRHIMNVGYAIIIGQAGLCLHRYLIMVLHCFVQTGLTDRKNP